MAASPVDIYRRQIERELQAGNATEHTHRPALKTLIESLQAGVTATNEPKRVECGAPDRVIRYENNLERLSEMKRQQLFEWRREKANAHTTARAASSFAIPVIPARAN